jgi:hypothetical protein
MARSVTGLSGAILVAILLAGSSFVTTSAMSAADKAAVNDATAKCKAQIKEQARLEEMSLYERRKAVKKCVQDLLAGH